MGLGRGFWLGFILFCVSSKVVFSDQDGFLSLSCGGMTSFVDSSNLTWVSDGNYVSIGNTATASFVEGTSSSQLPIRFFPNSPGRKCYRLPVRNISSSILVRTQFVYKNYDGLSKPPAFSVSLGTAISTTINLSRTDPWTEEFIWLVNKDILPLCLQSLPDAGFPVISTLEVRPLPEGAYRTGMEDFSNKFLRKSYRISCGCNNVSLRYPMDQYDRIWDADLSPFHISPGFEIRSTFNSSSLKETPPAPVLQTARISRTEVLTYNLPLDTLGDYYVVLYFAGILPISPSFDVLINGDIIQSNYTVKRSEVSALFIARKGIKSLDITMKSTSRYPQINAIEVYEIVDIPLESSSTTVSALQVFQQSTGLDLGWDDDPCSPMPWDHIGCEGNSVVSLELSDINLRSISPTFGDLLDLKSLDLHNTSLAGEIQNLGSLQLLEKLNLSFNQLTSFGFDLEDLINLQILDLQSNRLQGIVPDSLGELKDLHLLNLENNQLQGTLPLSLNRESLEVRTSGNLCLSFSSLTCNGLPKNRSIETPEFTIVTKKKHNVHNHLAIVLSAVGGAILILLVVSLSVFFYTRRKRPEVTYTARAQSEMRNWNIAAKLYSHKEIKAATNKFKEVIGRGSFGTVYLGKLPDGKLVAVKVRFDNSQLGADSFMNEVSLLSQIRHQNLVSLEGFYHESKQQILVYEYLPGGSLADNLYGASSKRVTLSWVRRLKIAVDAAKGLDYLHNGSDPRIIHRDVKSSNILLDADMNAKVCDFGLSKRVTRADATHVTTVVKGTAGYLDPEYYSTQQLTEKSDVYSFGVVLLELICGREPLRHSGNPDSFNLVLWAKPYLQAGAFQIVDESLNGTFDVESMRKVAIVASRSVERDAPQRPCIAEVLRELKEAYSIQLSFLASSGYLH
ncbi:probable LRR receptor-like serine/threonine-protein kinase At5g48740 [Rhododendron vialii]|uniref:probable LRR receptor-like serine/threonine-protein kinase At5g48740 n=1 Tax=Rhododendron vialii TaxID=182163 RepID=UPI00265EDE1F|nr:probable LRR receptor-like serine/threonine-protein kinase At5g48740 [Rhododendron vialii]